MPRKMKASSTLQPGTPLIVEVEGYEGEDGEIVVENFRAATGAEFGRSDQIYCIAEMGADGMIRFNDWGYATAAEAREAVDGRRRAQARAEPSVGASGS